MRQTRGLPPISKNETCAVREGGPKWAGCPLLCIFILALTACVKTPPGPKIDPALASLLSERLLDAMKRAGARPVTLTAKGIRY